MVDVKLGLLCLTECTGLRYSAVKSQLIIFKLHFCPLNWRLVQGVPRCSLSVGWARLQPPCDPVKDKWLQMIDGWMDGWMDFHVYMIIV